MKRIVGLILIVLALVILLLVYLYIFKKGIYKGDFLGLLIDSVEFLGLIGAIILVGAVLVTAK